MVIINTHNNNNNDSDYNINDTKKNDYNHDEINHILFARQYIKVWMSSGN